MSTTRDEVAVSQPPPHADGVIDVRSGETGASAPASAARQITPEQLDEESVLRSARQQCAWIDRYPRRGRRAHRRYLRVKRAIDLAAVLSVAPIWAPVMAVVAAAIKLDDPASPVMFAQWRTGSDARRFKVYKFRSMVPNADELKESLRHLNLRTWPDFKVENDPRITRPGTFLRATSLDELPQLLNVLRGDMSLVGPRPTSLGRELYEDWQLERFDVPSGVTGLWQIVGRGTPSFVERVRLDVAYVDRQCLLLDLEILLRTLPAVLSQRGAG